MIVKVYFFCDEAEQLQGPFVSESDAEEASKIYGVSLSRETTQEEQNRYKELTRNARDLREQLGV